MIKVTRLNGSEYYINPDLIETMEETPDTVVTLVNDKKLIVKEHSSEIISRIIEYNRKIFIDKKNNA
ncbi:MAG: flagellar FlbD family protein [Spirochaetia bacterium]|nr:flagellar FlbD family protein [Spirochaetia bacterium]